MTGTGATDVLTRLLHDWQQAFNAHRPAEIAALFSQDALFQGISPRLGHGPQEIFDYYARVVRGTTAQVKVVSGGRLSQETVHGFAEVTFTAPTGDVHLICLSIVAKRAGGIWLIHQYHASTRHVGGGSAVRETNLTSENPRLVEIHQRWARSLAHRADRGPDHRRDRARMRYEGQV